MDVVEPSPLSTIKRTPETTSNKRCRSSNHFEPMLGYRTSLMLPKFMNRKKARQCTVSRTPCLPQPEKGSRINIQQGDGKESLDYGGQYTSETTRKDPTACMDNASFEPAVIVTILTLQVKSEAI